MVEIIYYIIISAMALLLLYSMTKKRPLSQIICIVTVLVPFALRALRIK